MKTFVLVAVGAAMLALGVAAPAGAATPCWRALINDWYDGRIDQTYPTSCYTQAIQHLPQDVETYSSAKGDILRALQAQLRNGRNDPPTWNGSSNGGSNASSGSTGSKGIITRAIEWLGPSNASAVPLPLLILAGVAFLLLAAAGGSYVSRRLQNRRLPPPAA
ncbi:MAG: hypothetical protein ACYDA3_08225 [Gaiellaceae bacterium]